MGFFSNKDDSFKSNNKLVEIIGNDLRELEDEVEKRYLYRNVESINFVSGSTPGSSYSRVLVKYKDLKVRSALEVKMIKDSLLKEAGLGR